MSGCHEPTKSTRDLIIEFIDNCNQSFDTLENLIKINEAGLNKCFEWIEKSENGYIQRIGDLGNALHCLSEENHKLMKIEARLLKTEEEFEKIKIFMENTINSCMEIKTLMMKATLEITDIRKIPHKCPVCEGTGNHSDQTPRLMVIAKTQTGIICCESCEGKGIIWG